ncbi:uncharacterized protein [Asterias amurensis]|uniref:uncharacterized protein isoform X1 n=1 Tax=Asterias amurensis TaxID=7602 RepID=UPI003AB8B332
MKPPSITLIILLGISALPGTRGVFSAATQPHHRGVPVRQPSLMDNIRKDLFPAATKVDVMEKTQQIIDQMLQQKLQRTKEMYKLEETPSRKRRSISSSLSEAYIEYYQLIDVEDLDHLTIPDCIDIAYFTHNDHHYIVAASVNSIHEQTFLYHYHNEEANLLQTLDTADVQDLTIFQIEEKTILIVMESNSDTTGLPTGTVVYQFDNSTQNFGYIQRITTTDPTKPEAFITEDTAYVIFAGAFVETVTEGFEHKLSALYKWEGGHLDMISTFITGDAVDVFPFTVFSQIFVGLANRSDSHLLHFNPHLEVFERYQDISVSEAVDWEHFYLGQSREQDHFLAVASGLAGASQSIIYKYFHNEFVPFQAIVTTGAHQWHAITNPSGTLRTLALASDSGISFYVYNGWIFEESSVSIASSFNPGRIHSFISFIDGDQMLLGLADNSTYNANIIKLNFTVNSPVEDLHEAVNASCLKLKEKIASLAAELNGTVENSTNLVYINSTEVQYITGNKTFKNNVTVNTLVARSIDTQKGLILDDGEKVELADIVSNQTQMLASLQAMEDKLKGAVRKTGPVQIITGRKTFLELDVSVLEAETVSTGSDIINTDVNLTDLTTNTWYKDRDQVVNVGFSIAGNLTVVEDLAISGTLDSIQTSSIVTLTGNHTITGSKHFQASLQVKGNLDAMQSIDGVRVSEDNLLLTYGAQTIQTDLNVTGYVTFSNDVEVDGLVDGCDVSALYQDAVLTIGDFNITGNKTFTGDLVPEQGVLMGEERTIDGVDISVLNQTVLRDTGYQKITGNYTFTSEVSISGDVTVDGLVDGINIPTDILVANSATPAVLTGHWVINDDMSVEDIIVQGSIDGIAATGGGTGLEVLLTNGVDQTVEGAIIFSDGLILDGSSTVDGLVDGVDIPSIVAEAVNVDGNQVITGDKTFASDVTFQQDLLVDGFVNGINITSYESNALRLLEEDGVLVFNGNVTLLASQTTMAGPLITNGQHTFGTERNIEAFVIQGRTDSINGLKIFSSDVSSTEDVEALIVNSINMSYYLQEVIRTIPGKLLIIEGNVTFWNDVIMKENLDIQSEMIDGVLITDIVTIFNASYVKLNTTFINAVIAQDITIGFITLSGLLNGDDVRAIDANTLKINADGIQYVTGTKTFLNGLTVIGKIIVVNYTNGFDLSVVADDAVYTNVNETLITGAKVFTGIVQIPNLDALDHVDSVHIPTFNEQVVKQFLTQTIEGSVHFTQSLHFQDDLTVAMTINDHIVDKELNGVLLTTNSTYNGNLQFSDIISGPNITIDGFIDGFKMEDFVLRVSDFQTITGEKVFIGTLTGQETMIALLLNGVSLDDLNAVAARHNETTVLFGYTTFASGITLEQNLTADILVDTVDVRYLEANALLTKKDGVTQQTVYGNGTLDDIYVLDNVTYNGTLDGINLKELEQTYMSLTLPQTVTGNKTFVDTLRIACQASLITQTIILDGDLNGVDLEIFAQSVWIDGRENQILGVKTFAANTTLGNLVIDGVINGLDLSDNAVVTNQVNIITGIKNFTGSPVSFGSITMTNLMKVDGVDLSVFQRNAVTLTGNYNILFPIEISGIILQNNLIAGGKVDGIVVSADNLLLETGTQEVTGVKRFSLDVSVAPNILINGLVNGVDLVELLNNTLLKSIAQTIEGEYTFHGTPIMSDITTLGYVDGLRIPELYRFVYTYPSFTALNISLLARCQLLDHMHYAQENAAVLLSHLDVLQAIDTVGYGSWHSFYYNKTQWLILGQRTTFPPVQCIQSHIYQWDQVTEQYQYYMSIHPKSAKDVDSFVINDRLFLVVAAKNIDAGDCTFPSLQEGVDIDGIVTLNRSSIPSDFLGYSTTSVLIWLPENQTFYLYQALPCISPMDVEIYIDPLTNQTCIAISNELHIDENFDFHTVLPSYIFCLESLETGFYLKDYIITVGANKMKHFFVDGVLHLTVANYLDDIRRSFTASSSVFQQVSNGSFTEVVTMESTAACDILAVSIEDNHYIIIANSFTGTLNNENFEVPVTVFKYSDTNTVEHQQDIDAYGAIALESFRTTDRLFIIIVDRTSTSVYQYKGIDLFVKIQTLKIYDVSGVTVFPFGDTGVIQVAIAAYVEEDLFFEEQIIHALPAPSMVLNLVILGEKVDSLSCSGDTPDDYVATGITNQGPPDASLRCAGFPSNITGGN